MSIYVDAQRPKGLLRIALMTSGILMPNKQHIIFVINF